MRPVKNIIVLFFAIFLSNCGQQSPQEEDLLLTPPDSSEIQLSDYIQKPEPTDSMCIKDIQKAKNDVSKGRIVFCMPSGFFNFQLRHEKYIRQLCEKNKIIFHFEMFSDVIITGQTQGCYGSYMDKIISEKFGANFKEQLLAEADNLLLASNDTVVYYLCDKRPQIPGKEDYETTLEVSVSDKLRKLLKADKEGNLPFMDIGFYIDKSGNASGYFLNFFMDADNKSNQKLEDELYKIAVDQLKEIKHWDAGIVKGQKVITENNVRVYF